MSELQDRRLEIFWEDPPPSVKPKPRRLEWESILGRLTAHPGKWARIRTYAGKSGAASDRYRLMKGEIKHLVPKGTWEFESRQILKEDGTVGSALYCRYMGK